VVLVIFVLPELELLFKELGQELPLPTVFVLGASDFLRNYGLIGVGIVLALVFVLKSSRLAKNISVSLSKLVIRIPYIRQVVIKTELASFFMTLASLMQNGVSALHACELAVGSVRNTEIRTSFQALEHDLARGQKLGMSLADNPYLTRKYVSIIVVGEESSNLETALHRAADMYQSEVDHEVRLITKLAEPAMIIIVGLFVGFIILAAILPIFSLDIGGVR